MEGLLEYTFLHMYFCFQAENQVKRILFEVPTMLCCRYPMVRTSTIQKLPNSAAVLGQCKKLTGQKYHPKGLFNIYNRRENRKTAGFIDPQTVNVYDHTREQQVNDCNKIVPTAGLIKDVILLHDYTLDWGRMG